MDELTKELEEGKSEEEKEERKNEEERKSGLVSFQSLTEKTKARLNNT